MKGAAQTVKLMKGISVFLYQGIPPFAIFLTISGKNKGKHAEMGSLKKKRDATMATKRTKTAAINGVKSRWDGAAQLKTRDAQFAPQLIPCSPNKNKIKATTSS